MSLTEDSPNARSVNAAFDSLRRAELVEHTWSFAVERVALAASTTTPAFGKARYFPLPSDFLRLLPPDPSLNYNDLDWQIEGSNIATDDSAPLNIRYIKNVEDANLMDPLFREALAARIAYELCEEITQSNTKRQLAEADYEMAINKAKRTNAIQRIASKPPEDVWVTVRN